MKRCEKCGFCYPDETEFCERCSGALTEYDGPKKTVEHVISDKESSRRWCSAVRKLCYYLGCAMIFIAIPISVLYGWNTRNLENCVRLILIFGIGSVLLFTLSCILESLIYIAFGSMYEKSKEKEEE